MSKHNGQKKPKSPQEVLQSLSGHPTIFASKMDEKGRIRSVVDGSVWLAFKVPTGSIADAKSFNDKLDVFNTAMYAIDALAKLSSEGMSAPMRRIQKNNYRAIHLMLNSVPVRWNPQSGHEELDTVLRSMYPNMMTVNRTLLLYVKLKSSSVSQGLKGLAESIAYTVAYGGTQMSDYDQDYNKVVAAMGRAGIAQAKEVDVENSKHWWSQSGSPDTINSACAEHLHVFNSSRALYAAEKMGLEDCSAWSDSIPEQSTISFAALESLDDIGFTQPDTAKANWMMPLVQAGALCVSVRALVEPTKITSAELRRRFKQTRNDIEERQNKLGARAQANYSQEDKLGVIEDISNVYETGNGTASLVDTSVIFGFDGQISDYEQLCADSAARLRPMQFRQLGALAETMPLSSVRSNQVLHDFPSQTIVGSGIQALSKVGDSEGVLRGFTELDDQPVWHSQEAAYRNVDSAPVECIAAGSGAGKALSVTQLIRTKRGPVKMGDIQVGDRVSWRGGGECSVTSIHEFPARDVDAYRLTLSDGQVITADGNHQWVVSDIADRKQMSSGAHDAAIEHTRQVNRQVEQLRQIGFDRRGQKLTADELATIIRKETETTPWLTGTKYGIRASLRMMDTPSSSVMKPAHVPMSGSIAERDLPVYDLTELCNIAAATWSVSVDEHSDRQAAWQSALASVEESWTDELISRRDLAKALGEAGFAIHPATLRIIMKQAGILDWIEDNGARPPKTKLYPAQTLFAALSEHHFERAGHPLKADSVAAANVVAERGGRAHAREAARMMIEAGAPDTEKTLAGVLARFAKAAGLDPLVETVPVVNGDRARSNLMFKVFEAQRALNDLADRLLQVEAGHMVTDGIREKVMSTSEMLAAGAENSRGAKRFAIRLSEAVDGIERDLPVDPYVFGAWLGDGCTGQGTMAQDSKTSDMRFLRDQFDAAGYATTEIKNPMAFGTRGLRVGLRASGVLHTKHIPNDYQTASVPQRLALLQGLMDTDGHVDKVGRCALSLSDERLAMDAVDLIRSLGIKASWRKAPAGYKDEAGNYVECKDRYRISFTTAQRVFRMPRKLERLPEKTRETQNWLYIESIEPAEPEDMRCITVDSPDSTYLIAGYVPTHNTQILQWEAFQTAIIGNPQVLVNPKRGSSFHPALKDRLPADKLRRYTLDDIQRSDGAYDPIRYSPSKDDGVESAASLIASINPWGTQANLAERENDLLRGLNHGVANGADCIGEALRIAAADRVIDKHLYQDVLSIAEASPKAHAMIGTIPGGESTTVFDGTTLIEVGDSEFNLPQPGATPTLPQRTNLALIRQIVMGSAAALMGRRGVIRLDEAWVFLGSAGRDLDQLARLTREWQVSVELYTQKISDALDTGLRSYMTRGAILHIDDEIEIKAACKLMDLEATKTRVARIRGKAEKDPDTRAPNWDSLRALKDPQNPKHILRGSVAYYMDLYARVVPVEIMIPPKFLTDSDTGADAMDTRRKAAAEAGAAA